MAFQYKALFLTTAMLSSAATWAQPAEIFLSAADDASITVKKTLLEDGSVEIDYWANTPELLDIHSMFCHEAGCRFDLILKMHGPVDMTGFNINRFTPYNYASVTQPDIGIDLELFGSTPVLLSEAYTTPSLDPEQHADFVASGNARADVTAVDGPYVKILGGFPLLDFLPEATTQYQTFQIVGSGIQWTPLDQISRDYTPYGEGNKGTISASSIPTWPYGFQLTVNDWNTGAGHYAAMSALTFGDSPSDEGRDLSGYNTLEATLSCTESMVVEAFFGFHAYDSSKKFLDDIVCDGELNTYTWDISGEDKTDIQTALWLHIPEWKNRHLGQTNTLDITLRELALKP